MGYGWGHGRCFLFIVNVNALPYIWADIMKVAVVLFSLSALMLDEDVWKPR